MADRGHYQRLLRDLPEPPEVKATFTEGLLSFRGEGGQSLQMVIAVPPVGLPYTYAEFDLDLGNPCRNVLGFVVHMGELLDGKPTNHLDLRRQLAKTSAERFLYYEVVAGQKRKSRVALGDECSIQQCRELDLLTYVKAVRAGRFPNVNPETGVGGGAPGINAIIEARREWVVIVLANLDPPAAASWNRHR